MPTLADVTVEELREALADVEGKKPTQRLITAIAYKRGVTQTELADWYGVQRRTIYNWLSRFDERPIEEAIHDDDRPGRPRKLDPDQQAALTATLGASPSDAGFEASSWTPTLVREYVAEAFGVDYSEPSCRRLLREAQERVDE
jgi:transposase